MTSHTRTRLATPLLLALAVTPASAADISWLGAQYTPGPGYPAPWPAAGSFFDPANWQNFSLPASTDTALFGPPLPLSNGNAANAPHTVHFGNFGYLADTVIPGGSATLAAATLAQDAWTFDFASAQNPDFTGTLTPSAGTLTVGTLSLSPATGQSTSLTLQNGTLTAARVSIADQGGTGLLLLQPQTTLLTTEVTLGLSGLGAVTQSGGLHSSNSLSLDSGSIYTLTAGTLQVIEPPDCYEPSERIGRSGSGTFIQSGGTHTAEVAIDLGCSVGSSGVYVLSGGQLVAKSNVGLRGTGTFIQSGGTHHGGYSLDLGCSVGSSGVYVLSDGHLLADPNVGLRGTGTFTQTGGTVTAVNCNLGYCEGSSGTFSLSGGQLTAYNEILGSFGTGVFIQTGGSNTTNTLTIYPGSLFSLTGGSLQINQQLILNGSVVLGGTTSLAAIGLLDLGQATLQDVSQVHITMGPNSLVVLPPGISPASFAGLSNPTGITANAGSPIHIPAGAFVSLAGGPLTASITCSGTLKSTGTLVGGIQLLEDSSSASIGTFQINAPTCDLSTGQLSVGLELIQYRGTVTQTGGSHTVGMLVLDGMQQPGNVTFALRGGQLTANTVIVGWDGTGVFLQTGGSIKAGTLGFGSFGALTSGHKGTGSYELSNGQLTTSTLEIGSRYGSGTFTQTGGTHVVMYSFQIATFSDAVGIYTLSNGQLTTSFDEYVGRRGSGTFTQTGGTHTIAKWLVLGSETGASGTYLLSEGQLTVSGRTYIGGVGSGTFIQTGGSYTGADLFIDSRAQGGSSYTLSGGQMTAKVERIGDLGAGLFIQSGGTHTVAGAMALAYHAGDTGTYSLSDTGLLSVKDLYIGGGVYSPGGAGTLAISGGTATIANTLKLWNSPNTTLTLSGGTLSVKTLDIALNPAGFNWTAGTLIITGPTAPALTIPTAGAFQGAATIKGSLINHGQLSPGQSPGLLTIQGDFTQTDTATLLLKIAGPALPDFDRLIVPGTTALPGNITLAGTVALAFLPGYIPAPGDSFDLLDWTCSFTDNHYTFDFTRAPLPSNFSWDTSAFNTFGILTIVPEPATLALLALAAPLLLTRRRPYSLKNATNEPA